MAKKSKVKLKSTSNVDNLMKKVKKSKVSSLANKNVSKTKLPAMADGTSNAKLPSLAGAGVAKVPSSNADQLGNSNSIIKANAPMGEQIESAQQIIRNDFEGANVFDDSIGYGVALPGESGVQAVERIKAERTAARKAKVKRK